MSTPDKHQNFTARIVVKHALFLSSLLESLLSDSSKTFDKKCATYFRDNSIRVTNGFDIKSRIFQRQNCILTKTSSSKQRKLLELQRKYSKLPKIQKTLPTSWPYLKNFLNCIIPEFFANSEVSEIPKQLSSLIQAIKINYWGDYFSD